MYENPKLNRVGNAEEVILGIAWDGDDMDPNWVQNPFEFAAEVEMDEE